MISDYIIEDTWEEAMSNTDKDLIPIAVMLVHVPTLPLTGIELALGDDHYPYVLVSMTTKFIDRDMDGKLGWNPIEGDLKQSISHMLHDISVFERWVFLSQKKRKK